MGNSMAQLIILWYDNFGDKRALLHSNGMTAIPKNFKKCIL